VSAHPPEPGGTRRHGKVASGRRGRRRGVQIKPGSVKQARAEAGLSFGQVAGDDISRTAIYFVETGKAKPSIETLTLIAQRTGKPIEFFLLDPGAHPMTHASGVAEVERLLATGENAGAIAAAESVLAHRPDAATAARLRFMVAMAHLRSGDHVRGRREVSAARAYYESVGDTLMVAESLGTEASAAYLMLDPSALALAEAGLARCREIDPVPATTEARLLSILGSVHTANHDWDKAIESYESAVRVGTVVQDLLSLSVMYGDLSLAYQETGRIEEAARYAHRALTIHETLNNRLSQARVENNLALLIHRQGNLADAFRHANRSLQLWEELGVETGKAHVLMTLCELEFARNDLDRATEHANSAIEVARRVGEATNVAEASLWLGQIAESRHDLVSADEMFSLAIAILDDQGPGERLSRAHALYAEALEARGDVVAANAELKLALKATWSGATGAREARAVTA
jgi:tetratricopeptide (TPR) repeat protein